MANSASLSAHLLRRNDGHIMKKVLEIEVEGQCLKIKVLQKGENKKHARARKMCFVD